MSPRGKTNVRNNLRMCYWNIGGAYTQGINKLDDKLFLQEIEEYDLVILAETHVGNSINFNIPGCSYYPVCRPISSNGRYYGGLGIFRNTAIKNYVKILPSSSHDYQWIKFDKNYFNLPKDTYLCAAYIPPANSSYSVKLKYDILQQIEKDNSSISAKRKCSPLWRFKCADFEGGRLC